MLAFGGFCLSALWAPKLLDNFGRKRTLLFALAIQFSCKLMLLFLPTHNKTSVIMIYLLILINGLQTVPKCSGCYSIMIEMAPEKYHSLMGTCWNMSEGFIFIVLTFYWRFISKEWRWSVMIGMCECVIGYVILIFIIPESPKWLYDKGRY